MDIDKEDGQNDYLICQLKSTDAESIRIRQHDLHVLEDNAAIAHKLPVFAIQFLNSNEVWIMAKPKDFPEVAEYINTGEIKRDNPLADIEYMKELDPETREPVYVIKSSGNARERFHSEREKQFNKTRSAR